MTNELRPTRASRGKINAELEKFEGTDPVKEAPPAMTDVELARASVEVFDEDLADPDDVHARLDAMVAEVAAKIPVPGLVARLAAVISGLPNIEPDGTNAFFKYKFISDKQVLGVLRPRLSRAGIVIVPETVEEGTYIELTTKAGQTSRMTRMLVTFRVMDAYGGESFTGQSVGYGDDSGDKGANKAYTAAFKNFLIKLCMIGGESDLEADNAVDERAADQVSGRPITISQGPGVSGIRQGGRQTHITVPQMEAIGSEIDRLGITFEQLQKAVKAVTGEDIAQKLDIQKLTFQQAGDLIQALASATPPEATNEPVETDNT